MLHFVETAVPEVILPNTVAMHVRRGDYLQLNHIFNVLPISYYTAALSRINKIDNLIITSDDIPWCQDHFAKLPYKVIYSPFLDVRYDFLLLSRSKRLVMANSSLSWWAAYIKMLHFGNGTVIAPRPWFNLTGPNAKWNSDNFYMPHWQVLTI